MIRPLDDSAFIHIYSSQHCPPGGGRIGHDREPVAETQAKESRGPFQRRARAANPGSESAAKSPRSHGVEQAGLKTCSYSRPRRVRPL
jgi:hypothetical protein